MSVGSRTATDSTDQWERRYSALKSKYEALFNETFNLSEKLHHAHTENKRLKHSNKFLIDTLSKLESADKRAGRLRKNRIPASEATAVISSALNALKETKTSTQADFTEPAGPSAATEVETERRTGPPTSAVDPAVAAEMDGSLCTAMLGPGRACKTKRSAGSQYCWRHAPLDPNSGMIFCRFEDPLTHKKCSNTVAKNKKPLLCAHHVSKAGAFLDNEEIMNGATPEEIAALVAAKTQAAD